MKMPEPLKIIEKIQYGADKNEIEKIFSVLNYNSEKNLNKFNII